MGVAEARDRPPASAARPHASHRPSDRRRQQVRRRRRHAGREHGEEASPARPASRHSASQNRASRSTSLHRCRRTWRRRGTCSVSTSASSTEPSATGGGRSELAAVTLALYCILSFMPTSSSFNKLRCLWANGFFGTSPRMTIERGHCLPCGPAAKFASRRSRARKAA